MHTEWAWRFAFVFLHARKICTTTWVDWLAVCLSIVLFICPVLCLSTFLSNLSKTIVCNSFLCTIHRSSQHFSFAASQCPFPPALSIPHVYLTLPPSTAYLRTHELTNSP
ncbi:uncharacterized protein IWZ02DRAFT_290986 [Phyllosticta citriasiana]|uniref:uncharacterized protein n=1 Tax=Phyllosticta citriasiana TaxID=595635 RepID=UPI0030FDDD6B